MHEATSARAPYVPTQTPHAGQLVWLSPAAGFHHAPYWALVVSAVDGIVEGYAYLRTCPVDEVSGDAVVDRQYVRIGGLLVRDV